MSAKTSLPGYSGYIPKYQVEYPLNKAIPAYKYEDINPERLTLKSAGRWVTNYNSTLEPKNTFDEPNQREIPGVGNPLLSSFRRINKVREGMQATRDLNEFETKPPSNWGTTYGSQFNGWKQDRELRKRRQSARAATPADGAHPLVDSRRGETYQRKVLQGLVVPSSYNRSFGPNGHDPRHHYVETDGKAVFSRRATTADLFSGTNKGTLHVPGYMGYNPESRNNVNTVRDNRPKFMKDNLIETFRYQMPGCTVKVSGPDLSGK